MRFFLCPDLVRYLCVAVGDPAVVILLTQTSMEPIIEQRVNELCDSMAAIGNHIDEVSKWLDDNWRKAPGGRSFGDVMTTALLGGGLIGMALNRKIRTRKQSEQIIYDGMTADGMGQDIVDQLTKLVDCQCEVQRLIGKEDERYYGYANRVFQYCFKYYMAWLTFTSYYSMSHKEEFEGEKMTLGKKVRTQCFRQFQRLDLDGKTRKEADKHFR